jgi:hypothetical protein
MSKSTNTIKYFDWKTLYRVHLAWKKKQYSSTTFFFRFLNKRAKSYPFRIISLAHVPVKLTLTLFTLLFFPFRMVTQTLMIISLCNVAVYAVTGISCHDNRHINGCSIPWYVPSFYKDTFTPVYGSINESVDFQKQVSRGKTLMVVNWCQLYMPIHHQATETRIK